MKKIIIISIMCLFVSCVQAQSPYALETLRNLNQEELDVYYNKALKLQKSGKVTTIIGGVLTGVSGLYLIVGDYGLEGVVAQSICVGGLGTTVAGLAMYNTGLNRVKRINSIRNTSLNDIRINIQPCAEYNLMTQNYQPGLSLRINF